MSKSVVPVALNTGKLWAMLGGLSRMALFIIPPYFKIFHDNNALTTVSMLMLLGYYSLKRYFFSRPHIPSQITWSPPSSNGPYDLKFLSYNIFLRPPFVKNNADDFKNERLTEFLNHIDQFDVICLQELFNLLNWRQTLLLNSAREKGFIYQTKSMNPHLTSGKFIDAGLAIISKLPIVETDAAIYQAGNQIDSWAAKQVIYAKIQVSASNYVHVFTTHMQASYFDNHDSINVINDKARATQVQEMADFIKFKTAGSPYPVLITGDFNINARSQSPDQQETDEYKYMIDTLNYGEIGLRDLLAEANNGDHPITYGDIHEILHEDEEANTTNPSSPLDKKHKPRETVLTHTADHCCALCIDYILFADSAVNKKDKLIQVVNTKVEPFFVDDAKFKFSQLSDHYAVCTTLRINSAN
eukprot:TRINITY_DN18646_c0_g1_i1.p1 TRINITY_DN18646_c0_g1~~TRINITY_DN18646_c0_g1_i1.p1  ORF type:complete len:414 (-),score=59.72 TRINITY_DN18646_c0_g1_i1:107-1348(-)